MDNITHKKYFLTEAEIKNTEAYKDFAMFLLDKGATLRTKFIDDVLFEFATVEVIHGYSYTLVTVDSRIWAFVTMLYNSSDATILFAFNKDIVEELQNGEK